MAVVHHAWEGGGWLERVWPGGARRCIPFSSAQYQSRSAMAAAPIHVLAGAPPELDLKFARLVDIAPSSPPLGSGRAVR